MLLFRHSLILCQFHVTLLTFLQDGQPRRAEILSIKETKSGRHFYCNFDNFNKRLDEWVPVARIDFNQDVEWPSAEKTKEGKKAVAASKAPGKAAQKAPKKAPKRTAVTREASEAASESSSRWNGRSAIIRRNDQAADC
jgi:histone acetyltransferase HTATIP